MIIGDPYRLSVIIEKVQMWSDSSFHNGIFMVCIDGKMFPNELINVTLSSELRQLSDIVSNIIENEALYSMDKNILFETLYNITYPSDLETDNDYSYLISPQSLADNDYFIFAVKSKNNVKIIAAHPIYEPDMGIHILDDLDVSEIVISANEFEDIVSELKRYYINNFTDN